MILFEEFGEDFDSPGDVAGGATAREVRDDVVEALENWAGDGEASDLFEDFVDEVARVEVGGDEDIGLPGDLAGFGVGGRLAFVSADTGIDGGVELHFSGDKDITLLKDCEGFVDEVDSGVFATAAESREGKHGDAGLVREKLPSGGVSLFNNFAELVGIWVLASGHVGQKVDIGIAAHDGETRESLVRLIRFGVGGHREVVAAGEDDVAGRMLDAGNHGIGGAILDHFAGGVEVGRRESGDIRLGVEAMNGFLDNWVVEFGKDDFYHGFIIAYVGVGWFLQKCLSLGRKLVIIKVHHFYY